tara:strand:+ start:360 stop:575 length:216 start_codon:yes stop_codon:yes gene_type:complete
MPLFTILNLFIDSSFYQFYSEYFWTIPKLIIENVDKIVLLYTGKELLYMIKTHNLVSLYREDNEPKIQSKL